MSIKLNKLTDESVIEDIEICTNGLNIFLPRADENIKDVKINKKAARSSENLGYMTYQQELDTSTKYFKITSRTMIRVFTYIEEPQEDWQTRSPWELFKPLNIVIAFGALVDRNQIIKTKESKYNYMMQGGLEYITLYLRLMKSYLADESIDPDLVSRLNDKQFITKNNKEVTLYVKPMCDGLIALIDNDETAWLAALNLCIENHLFLVKRGDYKKHFRGFICMPAMALAKLGFEKGYQITVDSLYLPIQLMELS